MFFLKSVNEAELTVSLPDESPLIARCSSGKMLGLLLGQLYVGHNNLWARFVTVIVQFMYCLALCCVVALLACTPLVFLFVFLPTKIYS